MSGTTLLNELLDPFAQCLDWASLQRLNELQVSPSAQKRIACLAEKANEGLLSDEERWEYEAAINASDIMMALKMRAQHNLAAPQNP